MYMSSSAMSTAKSIGIGIAVGTVAAVAGTKMMGGSKRAYKKKMAKCMKTAEGVMDNICTMMK